MLTRPSHHSIYLATLFGSFDWEKIADFGLDGSLTHRALPALRQFADDLTRFLPSWPGFVWGWVPIFLNHDFSSVLEYSASCVVVPVSAEVSFEDVQGSNLHQDVFAQNQSAQLQESTGCLFQGKYMSALQVSVCYREIRE